MSPLAVSTLAAGLGLFAFLRFLEADGSLRGALASYGDDLVCLPLVLGGILFIQRWVGRLGCGRLSWKHGFLAFLAFSVYFEILLPRWNTNFTADPWDVLVYAAGWALFELLVNRPLCSPGEVAFR